MTQTTLVASDVPNPQDSTLIDPNQQVGDAPGRVLLTPGVQSAVIFFNDGQDFDPNGQLSDFNFLDEGQTATVTFEYTIDDDTDGQGNNDNSRVWPRPSRPQPLPC